MENLPQGYLASQGFQLQVMACSDTGGYTCRGFCGLQKEGVTMELQPLAYISWLLHYCSASLPISIAKNIAQHQERY